MTLPAGSLGRSYRWGSTGFLRCCRSKSVAGRRGSAHPGGRPLADLGSPLGCPSRLMAQSDPRPALPSDAQYYPHTVLHCVVHSSRVSVGPAVVSGVPAAQERSSLDNSRLGIEVSLRRGIIRVKTKVLGVFCLLAMLAASFAYGEQSGNKSY
jgi:hypothetical protein